MKKLGTYGYYHFYEGERGVFYGGPFNIINLIDYSSGESVEGFVEALRAATACPFSNLLDALETFIGEDKRGSGSPRYNALMAAYDALVADMEKDDDDQA